MHATTFHLPRVGWLLRHALRQRGLLVGCLLLAGMLGYLAGYLLLSYQGMTEEIATLPAVLVVFGAGLGGIALASAAFHERQARPVQDFHLALPVTRLELLAAQCVLLGAVYPVAVFVAFTLAAVSAPGLAGAFFAQAVPFAWAEHLRNYWREFVPGLLVFEAIWLLGSACFRSKALAKTAVVASLTAVSFLTTFLLAGYAVLKVSSQVLGCGVSLGLAMEEGMKAVTTDTAPSQAIVAGGNQPAARATEQDSTKLKLTAAMRNQPAARATERLHPETRLVQERAEAFGTAMAAAFKRWEPWATRQWRWSWLILLPLFCLLVTYIRLREQEA